MISKLKLRLCQRILVSVRRSYASSSPRNILKLIDRGVLKDVINSGSIPELTNRLGGPMTVYCGFDPTADSLHIGNLLAVIALIHCQRGGHKPICLLGGATALIGDPSGKSEERHRLERDVVEANVKSIAESVHRIFHNHQNYIWKSEKPCQDLQILNNVEWYQDKRLVDFLSVVGRHFRISDMLHKDSVKARLSSSEGMSFTEFTYQIFQAYDWLHLLLQHNCELQIGGNDQRGNMTAGYDLIRKVKTDHAWGFTVPLLTTATGEKFGKSAGNAVWLNANKTSPYELYQYFLNRKDQEVEDLLKRFTFLAEKEINDLMIKHRANPDNRPAQKKLAKHVVTLVHGEEGYSQAMRFTKVLFGGTIEDVAVLTEHELKLLFRDANYVKLQYEPGTTIMDMCYKANCFANQNDGISMFRQGGVYINQQRVTEPEYVLVKGQHILPNDVTLIKIGRKKYFLVKWYMT